MYHYVITCITLYCHVLTCIAMYSHILPCIAMYYYVLPCIAMHSHVLQCVTMYYNLLDCKTVLFFLKISKEIGKAWRKSLMRASLERFSIQRVRSDQGVQKCHRAVKNLFATPPSL